MKRQSITIKKEFEKFKIITVDDLFEFYKSSDPDVKKTTVNWHIYELVQQGVLQRVGRGKYVLGKARQFIPVISAKEFRINKVIRNEFPFVEYCIWGTSHVHEFLHHLSVSKFVVVEVEKEAVSSVFFLLKDKFSSTFKRPNQEIVEEFIIHKQNSIIVNSIVSEAPIQTIKNTPTSSLEKILVDLYCEKSLFYFLQGSELANIYKSAFEKYTINQSRLLRYADRRRKKQQIKDFIETIIRQ